jgi:hypothetical protein
VEKSITFEFSTYMSPQRTPAAKELYQDYLSRMESRVAATTRPKISE